MMPSSKPTRIHKVLQADIEEIKNKRHNGLISFTNASYEYALEKKKLEEQYKLLEKKLSELNNEKPKRFKLV